MKILFVCMGNICRSPAAEGIFKSKVMKLNLQDEIITDSAGTIGYHSGELPDSRMRNHAHKRGYELDHRARQFNPKTDFDEYDYILTMDDENFDDIKRLDFKKKYQNKLIRITDFSSDKSVKEVPDPYYSGAEGFENVLDILEDCLDNFLIKIKNEIETRNKK